MNPTMSAEEIYRRYDESDYWDRFRTCKLRPADTSIDLSEALKVVDEQIKEAEHWKSDKWPTTTKGMELVVVSLEALKSKLTALSKSSMEGK